jgi:hypothetical protein
MFSENIFAGYSIKCQSTQTSATCFAVCNAILFMRSGLSLSLSLKFFKHGSHSACYADFQWAVHTIHKVEKVEPASARDVLASKNTVKTHHRNLPNNILEKQEITKQTKV